MQLSGSSYLLCMWLLYTINTGVNITSVAIIATAGGNIISVAISATAGGNIISVAISATAQWQYHFCGYYCHRRWQYHFCGFLLTPVFRWQYHRPFLNHVDIVCRPASQPAVRPGCARCRAPKITQSTGYCVGFTNLLFRRLAILLLRHGDSFVLPYVTFFSIDWNA